MSPPLRRWWASRWPLLLASTALAIWCHDPRIAGRDRDEQLALALQREHGILLERQSPPIWGPSSLHLGCARGAAVAWISARAAREALHDIYLVRACLREDGSLRALSSVHNLSQTRLADDVGLVGDGQRAAWRLENQGHTYRIELAELSARRAAPSTDLGAVARWQEKLTALQETGRLAGIGRRSFRVEPSAAGLALSFDGSALAVRAEGFKTSIGEPGPEPHRAGCMQEEPHPRAQPGPLLHWALDRARASRFFGTDAVQRFKVIAQRSLARLDDLWPGSDPFAPEIVLDDPLESTLAPSAANRDLDDTARPSSERTRNDSSWPPAPLGTVILPALEGEGQWRLLAGDPFVRQRPGLPPPVITTFIRPDPRHQHARVLVALWDPRRIDLRFATGTEEPRSETGEVGSGLIPRDPELLSRLIGAFNGGFQTAHGAFGTFVDGRLYVPPRPFAATVARFDDGSVGFGTWPSSATIPEAVSSLRQNLTPLVAGGVLNPYQRTWWGGVPVGWMDTTRTVRTALCATRDGFIGYFYGSRADHEALGRALLLARCEYGMHLDMNSGHTGFEFYSVVPADAPALPPEQVATRWKAEAPVPELPALRYRARRLFRNMQLMHFPRYIRRQARDFFYLVERDVLPRAPLEQAAKTRTEGELGGWRTSGNFPFAAAQTVVSPDPARPDVKVRVIELDLKWLELVPAAAARPPANTVFSVAAPTSPESTGAQALWVSAAGAGIGSAEPKGFVLARAAATTAGAAWCWIDRHLLAYAAIDGAHANDARPLLERALAGAGCRATLYVDAPEFVALGGATDLAGSALNWSRLAQTGQAAFHFVRREWTGRRPLFPDTPVVAPAMWQPFQQ